MRMNSALSASQITRLIHVIDSKDQELEHEEEMYFVNLKITKMDDKKQAE